MGLLMKDRKIAKNFKNYAGQTINGWKVIELKSVGGGASRWLCRHLKCGNERVMRISHLQTGGGGRKSLCKCESHQGSKDQLDQMKERNYSDDELYRDHLREQNGRSEKMVTGALPVRRKVTRKFTDWEKGKMQAESYAKGFQARGWV